MTSNFFLNNLFTYRDQRLRGAKLVRGLLSFYAVCGMGALANIGIAAYAFSRSRVGLVRPRRYRSGTLWNYLATARFTWDRASSFELDGSYTPCSDPPAGGPSSCWASSCWQLSVLPAFLPGDTHCCARSAGAGRAGRSCES